MHCVSRMLWVFLQIEGQTLHQHKDDNSLCRGGLQVNQQYLQGMPVLCSPGKREE